MGGPEQALVLSISAGASELVIFTRRAGTTDCRTILQPVGQTLATRWSRRNLCGTARQRPAFKANSTGRPVVDSSGEIARRSANTSPRAGPSEHSTLRAAECSRGCRSYHFGQRHRVVEHQCLVEDPPIMVQISGCERD